MADRAFVEERVEQIAAKILARSGKVTAFDLLMGLGWLHEGHVKLWQRGDRLWRESLEALMQSTRPRRQQALTHFEAWGRSKGLEATSVAFFPAVREPAEELRVTADNDSQLERLFRLCFIDPHVSDRKRRVIEEKATAKPDLLVFVSFRDETCTECGAEITEGDPVFLSGQNVLCLSCADLDHLVFLPSGDVALTRRARKYSTLSAVVLRHHRRLRRQIRVGLLVTETALARAEEECLADAEARERRRQREETRRRQQDLEFEAQMTAEILRLFPGCPAREAEAIAAHTCQRSSGRVGRSAPGRDLAPQAIRLALRAHIRHQHTPYDELLFACGDRETARRKVAEKVDRIEEQWGRGETGRASR
ncbi:MAG: DUF2293 domain-containing protein [Lentisphaeria bacterium]|nr:DUF2293 domain-containing protein [Lentisphaeria bacterium]